MWLQKGSDWGELISGKDKKPKKKPITSPFIAENHCICIYMYKMFLPEALKIILIDLFNFIKSFHAYSLQPCK